MSQSQFSLLATRRFLPLFLAQFLSAFNDNVFKNALIILITYRAGETAGIDPRLLVTAAGGIFIFPFFLFSATAGVLADAYEKTKLIRIVKFIEIPLMLLAAAAFFLGNYIILLGLLFLVGTQAAFFGPLKYSILPEQLKEKELIGGNALVEAGTFLAILLGTILGGILVLRSGGLAGIAAIISVTAVAGWLASLRIPHTTAGSEKVKTSLNFIKETWVLLLHAMKHKDVFLSIIGISWFWLVGFTFLAQFPVYARDVLGANENIVTLFLTIFSVGIAFGSLVCNKLLKGKVSGVYVPLGAFGMTACIILFWLASEQAIPRIDILIGLGDFMQQPLSYFILASLFAIAAFGGLYIVPLYAIMQTRCDAGFRSRTVAVNNVLNALFMVGGAILTMLLLKMDVGINHIFLLIGLVNVPVAFLVRHIVRERKKANA
ncbi:MAG TPA: MFS transporter [Nitrososphaera sp.]|nr:MFS transporter [Nitrososphaera sp.]